MSTCPLTARKGASAHFDQIPQVYHVEMALAAIGVRFAILSVQLEFAIRKRI